MLVVLVAEHIPEVLQELDRQAAVMGRWVQRQQLLDWLILVAEEVEPEVVRAPEEHQELAAQAS